MFYGYMLCSCSDPATKQEIKREESKTKLMKGNEAEDKKAEAAREKEKREVAEKKAAVLKKQTEAKVAKEKAAKRIDWGRHKADESLVELRKRTSVKAIYFPYLARLLMQNPQKKGLWIGSGALISPNWIITAKHNVKSFTDSKDKQGYKIKIKFQNGEERRAIDGYSHPKSDIALVKLDRPIKNIPFPALQDRLIPRYHFKKSIPLVLTGTMKSWRAYTVTGHTNYHHVYAPDMLVGGDSGSPFLVRGKDGDVLLSTLMGGVSFGKKKYAHSAQIGQISSWIKEKMSKYPAESIKWQNIMDDEFFVP